MTCVHVQLIVVYTHFQLSVLEVLSIMEAKGEKTGEAAEQLERLLFILHTLVSFRNGTKITKPESVCQVRGTVLHPFLSSQRCKAPRVVINYNRCYKCLSLASGESCPHFFFNPSMQTVLQLVQSSTLSASCSRLLLQITSSLLLGENITLPKTLVQEIIQKVCWLSWKISFPFCVSEVLYIWMM